MTLFRHFSIRLAIPSVSEGSRFLANGEKRDPSLCCASFGMTQRSRLPPPGYRGFSLLEMLVVIILVALIATVVGVSISRSIFGAEVRSASRDVMSGLRYTRGQAILKREEQLFQVDVEQRSYQAPGRDPVTLPEGMGIRLLTARSELTGESSGAIRFFPDGSSTGGTVTLNIEEREWQVTVGWLTGEIGLKEGNS